MSPYDVIVSSVHDRADLLDRTLRSMLTMLDAKPERVIVHEDARAGQPFVEGRTRGILDAIEREHGVPLVLLERRPGGGLARAVLRLVEEARTEFVLYTQEDFDFLRPVPVERCLDLMAAHELHHVRFNKRKTMRVKGEDRPEHERFYKVEATYGAEVLCISDHWYFQASLWRTALAREGFAEMASRAPEGKSIDFCEMKFNRWYNTTYGGDVNLRDPLTRQRLLRTFIWGPIAEPAFIRHTGGDRRSQGWEPRTRSPNS